MITVRTTKDPVYDAGEYIAEQILKHNSNNKRILLLLSGGSGIKVGLEVAKLLKGVQLQHLFVTLTDERFGPQDHKDENWKQLKDQGFTLTYAKSYRPLGGENAETTEREFNDVLKEQLTEADYSIGIFGIGPDGHTAGIKPHSEAVEATDWAVLYEGPDFERLTMTFPAIRALDEIVIQAKGEDKFETLRALLQDELPLTEQPAQILKSVEPATLFTDYAE